MSHKTQLHPGKAIPSSVRDSTTDQSRVPRLKPILYSVNTMHPASRVGIVFTKTLLAGFLSNVDV